MQDLKLGTMLWRGKWLVMLSLLLSVALALFVTQHSKKVYAATAVLQIDAFASNARPGDNQLNQLQANETLAGTYAELMKDHSFLAQIRPDVLHGTYSLHDLEQNLDAAIVKDTALIKLTAEEASPERARALANDVASAFVTAVAKEAANRASTQRDEIAAQIQELNGELGKEKNAERQKSLQLAIAALTQQLATVVGNNIARGSSITLTAPPTASASPVKPRPILNMLAGVLLGMLLGTGLAWLRARLDRGLHSPEEAEELLAAPVLASIPLRKRFAPDDPVVGEAYDILRANLAFLSLDNALQVITFTSMNPGEGKTSTVEGLAYAGLRGGMNVLIVDGDVRTATLSSNFGARALPGLTNLIVGTMSVDDAVLEVEPGLCLLPAGPTPPNPPSLLSSGRMREVIGELRERFQLILFDSPPVAHLADASILAAASDGVALVGRIGVTQRVDLPGAVVKLRHTPTPVVGIVLLRPQVIDETYYPVVTEDREFVYEQAGR